MWNFIARVRHLLLVFMRNYAFVGQVFYQLRAQLIVSFLAFIATSSIGELHHVYRNMILETQYTRSDLAIAILSVAALSVFIWLSSILVLVPAGIERSFHFGRWFHRWYDRSSRSNSPNLRWVSTHSHSTAAIVGAISVLPLLGLALGLWLAIPNTVERDQESFTPGRFGPQNRAELSFDRK